MTATEFLRLQLIQGTNALRLPWADEEARWAELVFCVLFQDHQKDAAATRYAVGIAQDLGLLDPARLKEPSQSERATFEFILSQAGFSTSQIEQAFRSLKLCASAMDGFAGKPQLLLRRAAEAIRESIVAEFVRAGMLEDGMRAAVGHWLQNTSNLPISIDDHVVASFAEAHGFTVAELIQAADETGVNIAVLDDLIREQSDASGE
jgi:hypothetical protein